MFSSERDYYFAYGSNMSSRRMQERIRSARIHGAARLDGYIWCCNKRGRDGTGKANLMHQQGASVHGVLFSIKPKHWKKLDRIESGYERFVVEVEHQGEVVKAHTYRSELITSNLPSLDYFGHIVSGLMEHGLPSEYLHEIRREAGL